MRRVSESYVSLTLTLGHFTSSTRAMQTQNMAHRLDWWSNIDQECISETAIIAATYIPEGISSLPFVSKIPLRKLLFENSPTFFIKAFVSEMGVLSIREHMDWIPMIRIAQNCFEQNTIAQSSHNGKAIVLQTTKSVEPGDELKVWLSIDLLTQLNIPFLSPLNIISEISYKCLHCDVVFSQPNPLKVHIAFDCKGIIKAKELAAQTVSSETIQRNISSLTYSSQQNFSNNLTTKEPRTHPCVFCGKLYTRKYGLKIHLRTHTGQKPLECRYCGRAFSDPSNLNKHIRLHAPHTSGLITSPYKCHLCSKILVRRRDLERHVKSRHHIQSTVIGFK